MDFSKFRTDYFDEPDVKVEQPKISANHNSNNINNQKVSIINDAHINNVEDDEADDGDEYL